MYNGNVSSMLKQGTQHMSGVEEAVLRNIEAVRKLSSMTRTSLGPNGMNKMVVNHLNKLFVTTDAATIMTELEVEHPAAKLVVLSAQMQEQEVGDGTNFVVVLAGSLLEQAEELLRMGLHQSEIVIGYQKAAEKIAEVIKGISVYKLEDVRDEKAMALAIRPVIAAKEFGNEVLLADLVAKAAQQIMPKNPYNFNIDNIRIVKVLGSNLQQSEVVKGFVHGRKPEGDINTIADGKVVIYSCRVDSQQTESKGTILLKSAAELKNYNKSEEDHIEGLVQELASRGVKCVVSGSGFGEMALHFLNKYKICAVKMLSKHDLRRLAKVIGASVLAIFDLPEPEQLGTCAKIEPREIGSSRVTVFSQTQEQSRLSTIVLRSSTLNILDNVERALDDAINVVKAMCRDSEFLAGGGASEIELARILRQLGDTCPGLDQYAVKKFAEALEVVPRTLAENAGVDAEAAISKIYAAHENGNVNVGIDISGSGNITADMAEAKIYDLASVKANGIRLAAEAAITVLKVDQIIMAKRAGGPKPPGQ
eukprot:TRINITY_DN569_c0_g1_i1.p1 TRINITY_DN569_c0_g1~~TRINITY_DN569_c0_g1_i1.p1  ORF type:complete len:535 (+),score=215.98 TRINITY_DN569_c0_g1_i1:284-1888(+)